MDAAQVTRATMLQEKRDTFVDALAMKELDPDLESIIALHAATALGAAAPCAARRGRITIGALQRLSDDESRLVE